MRRFLLLAVGLLCTLSTTVALARRVAITDFAAEGIDAAAATGLADLLAIEVAKFEGFDVVTPADVRAAVDHAALLQLLGCDQDVCPLDLPATVRADQLITGRLSRQGGRTSLAVTLLEPATGRVVTRLNQTLGDLQSLPEVMRTLAVALVSGDTSTAPAELLAAAELSAETLEQVRVAQRQKSLLIFVQGGTFITTAPTGVASGPPLRAGGRGAFEIDYPVASWLWLTAGASASYYRGEATARLVFDVGPSIDTVDVTGGWLTNDFGVFDADIALGIKARRSYGLVLPFVSLVGTVDYLTLDLSNDVFVKDADDPDPPAAFVTPIPYRQSRSFGGGGRLAGGVDFVLSNSFGVSIEVSVFAKAHNLKIESLEANLLNRRPFGALFGVGLTVGGFYQL